MLETVLRCADLSGKETIVIIEGTYPLSGSDSEASFIAEEEHFLEKASPVLLSCGESVQVFSFIGKSAEYSTCSAFLDAIIIAPWGAGLTRHMFFAAKSYLLHTNCSNRNGMTNDYYSWEIPYTPKKISYLANQGGDFNCAANEEVVRLDPLRPDWAIFNDYSVDVINLSEELTQILAT